ncbi:hypothetical protein KAOT1_16383 [Kordia algicida OT-1]|uniref:Uncharacterized protein n=1 Tax=Kordia algicida OT-1 TaxID=391587 RepID=A9DR90_9FLAO|nr:hypothetical protein KAOT1_16383 [Kordia algicida OT-1]
MLLNSTLVYLLGDGNKEKAINKLQALKDEANSEEEFLEAFKREVNYDFFNALYSELNFNNISGIMRSFKSIKEKVPELKKLITNQKGVDKILNDKSGLKSIIVKTIFIKKNEEITDDELMMSLFNQFSISKERIANEEFGVDKKTFNKWLEETGLFKEEFYKPLSERGKKGVYLDEYVHIFETLFLAKEEGKLDIENNIDTYIDRLNNKMSFQKDDIVQICESKIKTQKEVLRKVAYYNFIDKFPYSLSKELVENMGSKFNY